MRTFYLLCAVTAVTLTLSVIGMGMGLYTRWGDDLENVRSGRKQNLKITEMTLLINSIVESTHHRSDA